MTDRTTVAQQPLSFADQVANSPLPGWGWMVSWRCATCGRPGGISRGWEPDDEEGYGVAEELGCGLPGHEIVCWNGVDEAGDPVVAAAREQRLEQLAHLKEGHRLLVDPEATDAQLAAGIRHLRTAARLAPLAVQAVWTRVTQYRRLAYRALILQTMQTSLPPVWQSVDADGVDLLSLAMDCGCAGPQRRACRHRDLCLAAAVWLDSPEAWAAGVDRAGRVAFFAELERFATAVDPWIAAQQPPDAA